MTNKDVKNHSSILFLGACPALAVTTSSQASLAIALAVFAILVLSSLLMSILKKAASSEIRLALSIIISAFFASIVQMLFAAYLPKVYAMLGVYVAIIAVNAMVVNCQIDVAENESILSVIVIALEFSVLVILMGIIREILGLGTCFGKSVPFFSNHTIAVFNKAGGAFIVFAILLAIANCFKKEAK